MRRGGTTTRRIGSASRATGAASFRGLAVIACAAVLGATLPATAQPLVDEQAPASGLTRYATQQLDWQACRLGECATLIVPRDYGDPSAGDLRIAVSRTPAKGAGPRLGSLVVNPGGPGEPGRGYARDVALGAGPALRGAYDIVGFDPRGVRASSAVECLTGAQTERLLMADPTPDTPREQATLWRLSALPSQGCADSVLARHVSTSNAARDLDILRAALGDERISWLGMSYGTQLGTRYAELFPDRVGRMVLDGAVDPSLDGMEISRDQSTAFQAALRRFAQDCTTHAGCIARTTGGVLTGINRILLRAERSGIGRGSDRVNEAQTQAAMFVSLYSPTFWPLLRTGLRQAEAGNGATLRMLSDLAWDRTGRNRYDSNSTSAFLAISCWDAPATPDRAGLAQAAKAWSRRAAVPALARAMAWGNAPCSQWFGHDPRPLGPADSATTAAILIVGTTADPATPYGWARALQRQLPTSRLLTFVGNGHTAYGNGNRCIDSAVEDYLVTGALPAEGTRCR